MNRRIEICSLKITFRVPACVGVCVCVCKYLIHNCLSSLSDGAHLFGEALWIASTCLEILFAALLSTRIGIVLLHLCLSCSHWICYAMCSVSPGKPDNHTIPRSNWTAVHRFRSFAGYARDCAQIIIMRIRRYDKKENQPFVNQPLIEYHKQ